MKRVVIGILICLCVVVFATASYQIVSTVGGHRKGQQTYQQMASGYTAGTSASSAPGPASSEISEEKDPVQEPPITVDFQALLDNNPNVVGWIYSEGTCINYPVVQGEDNSYYLKHLIDDTYNDYGTIFVDCNNRPGFADSNTIIYGHNMTDGMMFAELEKYAGQEYYEEHSVIWLLTPEQNYQIVLFAGYTTDGYSDTYRIFDGPCEELTEYVEESIRKSDFSSGVVPAEEDRLVMLSTCAYSYENARYVVHGILRPC